MKVFMIGPDEYHSAEGHTLLNLGHEVVTGYSDLRWGIAKLTDCDAICLLDGWWSSRDAICLQTIAAWLRMKVIDVAGTAVSTASLRG